MDCAKLCPVGKLEKLILATDGSQFSEGAIREAINFARKCSSKLYAVTAGVKKLLMGSSTEKVIGNAGCAVLVVKAG